MKSNTATSVSFNLSFNLRSDVPIYCLLKTISEDSKYIESLPPVKDYRPKMLLTDSQLQKNTGCKPMEMKAFLFLYLVLFVKPEYGREYFEYTIDPGAQSYVFHVYHTDTEVFTYRLTYYEGTHTWIMISYPFDKKQGVGEGVWGLGDVFIYLENVKKK